MTIKEMELRYNAAPALYDGGWRAEDRDELKDCYDLTDEELGIICDALENIENQNK